MVRKRFAGCMRRCKQEVSGESNRFRLNSVVLIIQRMLFFNGYIAQIPTTASEK